MRRAKTSAGDHADDPNRLVRREAGRYRSADDRFEVSQAGDEWFAVDAVQNDEFGQPRILGPFATLKAVHEALPQARRASLKPLPKRKKRR